MIDTKGGLNHIISNEWFVKTDCPNANEANRRSQLQLSGWEMNKPIMRKFFRFHPDYGLIVDRHKKGVRQGGCLYNRCQNRN